MAKIKRFGILKMAYFMGLSGVIMGFILALIMGISYSLFFSNIYFAEFEEGINFSFGWLNLLWFPLIYGIVMFLWGLIFTPITNLVLRIIGGIDLDLKI